MSNWHVETSVKPHTCLVCSCKLCFWLEGGWSVHAPKTSYNPKYPSCTTMLPLSNTSLTCLIVVNCTPESFPPAQWHWQSSKTNVLMCSRQSVGLETLSAWTTFSRSCCKRSPAVNWVTELCLCLSLPFPCEVNISLGAPGCRRSPECYLLLCLNSSITRNLWETGWLTVSAALCCESFWSHDV